MDVQSQTSHCLMSWCSSVSEVTGCSPDGLGLIHSRGRLLVCWVVIMTTVLLNIWCPVIFSDSEYLQLKSSYTRQIDRAWGPPILTSEISGTGWCSCNIGFLCRRAPAILMWFLTVSSVLPGKCQDRALIKPWLLLSTLLIILLFYAVYSRY